MSSMKIIRDPENESSRIEDVSAEGCELAAGVVVFVSADPNFEQGRASIKLLLELPGGDGQMGVVAFDTPIRPEDIPRFAVSGNKLLEEGERVLECLADAMGAAIAIGAKLAIQYAEERMTFCLIVNGRLKLGQSADLGLNSKFRVFFRHIPKTAP